MLGRLPSSDEPCWLVVGSELEDPLGASPSLTCPPVRPRPQTWKTSFLASTPSAHMPKDTSQRASRDRSGTPRRRESSRSAWAPSPRPPGAFAPMGAPRQHTAESPPPTIPFLWRVPRITIMYGQVGRKVKNSQARTGGAERPHRQLLWRGFSEEPKKRLRQKEFQLGTGCEFKRVSLRAPS